MIKRVIPILLYRDQALVKTIKFKEDQYIGDAINAIKIFNEKEVDELVFIDIDATIGLREPDYNLISRIASECFMPLTYGGGVTSIEQMKKIYAIGVEKIALNSYNFKSLELLKDAVTLFGGQSVIAAIDFTKTVLGKYRVYDYLNKKATSFKVDEYIKRLETTGCGEFLITDVSREGTLRGYNQEFFKGLATSTKIPIIANGGASSVEDVVQLLNSSEVSAAAASSIFVFQGKHKAVLITYPGYTYLSKMLTNV